VLQIGRSIFGSKGVNRHDLLTELETGEFEEVFLPICRVAESHEDFEVLRVIIIHLNLGCSGLLLRSQLELTH
jgi:hypothetical protein